MNKQQAEQLLKDSRDKIDILDKQILDLIIERTSLAQDIITSKKALGMDLFDAQREEAIHKKLKSMLDEINIDENLVLEIFDLLATISKNEQKKYL